MRPLLPGPHRPVLRPPHERPHLARQVRRSARACATPSALAAAATATATASVVSAQRVHLGQQWRARRAAVDQPGHRVCRRAEHPVGDLGRPGRRSRRARDRERSSALLAWPMTYLVPWYSTGGNGLPVATSTRPPVQVIRSVGVASASSVGLDIGMITGRSACRAISITMSRLNAPGRADVPISTVGCTRRTTSASGIPPSCSSRRQSATSSGLPRVPDLARGQVRVRRPTTRPCRSSSPEPVSGRRVGQPADDQRGGQLVGDPGPGRPGAEDDDPVAGQLDPGGPDGGQDGGEIHRAGALDVVVEAGQPVPVPGQQPPGVGRPDVLPVQQRPREHLLHGGDELRPGMRRTRPGPRAGAGCRCTSGPRAGSAGRCPTSSMTGRPRRGSIPAAAV